MTADMQASSDRELIIFHLVQVPVADADFAAVRKWKVPLLQKAAKRLCTDDRFQFLRVELFKFRRENAWVEACGHLACCMPVSSKVPRGSLCRDPPGSHAWLLCISWGHQAVAVWADCISCLLRSGKLTLLPPDAPTRCNSCSLSVARFTVELC